MSGQSAFVLFIKAVEQVPARFEEYQKALVELQTVYMEYQRELATKEGELTKDIIARMQRILRRIGQKEG